MNKFILVSVLILNAAYAASPFVEGYYWRDYEGIIPADAIPGGTGRDGKPIYIGQVLFENKLIPGKIYENNSKIYFMWGSEQSTDKNVRILCSQYPKKLQWIRTKHDEVPLLTNKMLVKGGYVENYFTYIGRVYAGGETPVGKVICQATDCIGLYVTKDGNGILYKDAFEILSYNSNGKVLDSDHCGSSADSEE